jgi:putative transcriptional regulator
MSTRKKSARRSRKSARSTDRTALGKRIARAAREVAGHLRGKGPVLSSYVVTVPDDVDVSELRARLDLSQAAFAHAFGLDLGAVQAWEQRRRRPDRAARVLLAVIAKEPAAVMRALAPKAAGVSY